MGAMGGPSHPAQQVDQIPEVGKSEVIDERGESRPHDQCDAKQDDRA